MNYPATKKIKFNDLYKDNSIEDHYNWLHDLESETVVKWLEEQHDFTDSFFEKLPMFEERKDMLRNKENKLNILSLKYQHDQYIGVYESPEEGLAVFVSDDLEEFNVIQKAGTPYTTLFSAEFSPVDPNLLIFSGYYKDETRVSVNLIDLSTEKVIDRFGFGFDHHWSVDGAYIYYSKAVVDQADVTQSVQEIYRYSVADHAHEHLYTFEDNAVVVYFNQSNETIVVKIDVNYHDSKLLFIEADGTINELTGVEPVDYQYIGTIDEELFFVADETSDQYQLISFGKEEGFNQRKILDGPIAAGMEAKVIADKIILFLKEDAQDLGVIVDKNGQVLEKVEMPSEFASVRIIGESGNTLYLYFNSIDVPPKILAYNGETNEAKELYSLDTSSKADHLTIKKHTVSLRDGATSTLYLVHDQRIDVTSNSPLLIYGYGGYGFSQTMSFSDPLTEYSIKSWCENGGVYANVILRGGGEYGKEWHDAGKLDRKQNTFNDLFDMTMYLHDQGISSPAKTAVGGASNGGLLVGAAFTQRPDLYACVLNGVGLADMLHFVKDPRGSMYQTEYGNPYNNDMFDYLKSYSPYHNVKEGIDYPAIYIQSGWLDTNVPAYHGMKFAAEIKNKNPQGQPALLRILPKGHHDTSHGEEHYTTIAERQCFVEKTLAIKPVTDKKEER